MGERATAPATGRADDPGGGDEGLRDRVEASALASLTRRTAASFPVRVWRNFLHRSGFLLSAGMSYMALFAVFAALFVVFSIAGLQLTSQPEFFDTLAELINTYVPGLIAVDGSDGVLTADQLSALAADRSNAFTLAGLVALGGLVWTAISWITYSRIAVRAMLGLGRDTTPYVRLKLRDALSALVFGAVLLVTASLGVATTTAFERTLALLGLDFDAWWSNLLARLVGLLAIVVLNTGVLVAMFRVLSGAAVPWSRLWPGSVLGALALAVLQASGGAVLGSASRNPLLATFTVFIALLLWFNLTSIITLVAASWIAVGAADRRLELRRLSPEQRAAEQLAAEREALVVAARVAVRDAETQVVAAGPLGRLAARRRLRRALAELADREAEAASAGHDRVGGST